MSGRVRVRRKGRREGGRGSRLAFSPPSLPPSSLPSFPADLVVAAAAGGKGADRRRREWMDKAIGSEYEVSLHQKINLTRGDATPSPLPSLARVLPVACYGDVNDHDQTLVTFIAAFPRNTTDSLLLPPTATTKYGRRRPRRKRKRKDGPSPSLTLWQQYSTCDAQLYPPSLTFSFHLFQVSAANPRPTAPSLLRECAERSRPPAPGMGEFRHYCPFPLMPTTARRA